jgi:hypothetical protein
MRGFVDRRVLVGVGLVVWACAKSNDSPLGGGAYDPNGKAGASGGSGKTGTGGSAAAGGSSATGGKGGSSAGGSSASGGSSAAGGSSATGGSGGTGGTGGSTGGSGGSGAGCSADPDLLENAEIVVRYIGVNTTASSSSIEARLFIENKMDVALDLARLSVRYWMTSEADSYILESYYQGDYIKTGPPEYVNLAFVDDGSDSHVAAHFTGGEIPSNAELWKTEFQIKLDGTNGEKFDQADDWSFAPACKSDPALPNDKITAYVDGTLVWGCEPSGKCPDFGMGGAGGQGGEAGAAGAGTGGGGSSAGGASGDTGMSGAGQGGA